MGLFRIASRYWPLCFRWCYWAKNEFSLDPVRRDWVEKLAFRFLSGNFLRRITSLQYLPKIPDNIMPTRFPGWTKLAPNCKSTRLYSFKMCLCYGGKTDETELHTAGGVHRCGKKPTRVSNEPHSSITQVSWKQMSAVRQWTAQLGIPNDNLTGNLR